MLGRSSSKRAPEIDTLIGRNTRVEGDIEFNGGCHVDGYVKGSISGADDSNAVLSISDTGTVEGSVSVPQLVLNGTVNGDVHATGRLELGASARVVGNVYYKLIEMAIGAEVNGQLIHSDSATPSPVLVTHQQKEKGDLLAAEDQQSAGGEADTRGKLTG